MQGSIYNRANEKVERLELRGNLSQFTNNGAGAIVFTDPMILSTRLDLYREYHIKRICAQLCVFHATFQPDFTANVYPFFEQFSFRATIEARVGQTNANSAQRLFSDFVIMINDGGFYEIFTEPFVFQTPQNFTSNLFLNLRSSAQSVFFNLSLIDANEINLVGDIILEGVSYDLGAIAMREREYAGLP